MVREIEFRGKPVEYEWNSRKKEYIPVVKKDWVFGKLLTNNRIITLTDEEVEAMSCFDMCDYQKLVDIETMGQYTERKDKNSKKIFEGDIVDWYGELLIIKYGEYITTRASNVIGENFKDVKTFGWYGEIQREYKKGQGIDLSIICYGEVVGNIYDNPELLGENI